MKKKRYIGMYVVLIFFVFALISTLYSLFKSSYREASKALLGEGGVVIDYGFSIVFGVLLLFAIVGIFQRYKWAWNVSLTVIILSILNILMFLVVSIFRPKAIIKSFAIISGEQSSFLFQIVYIIFLVIELLIIIIISIVIGVYIYKNRSYFKK